MNLAFPESKKRIVINCFAKIKTLIFVCSLLRHTIVRPGTSQVHTSTSSNDVGQNSSEANEEARMLVILLNGEKKLIRIPCSQQNIFLGQILQQVELIHKII